MAVFFERYYVDEGILVELQWWPDGHRCQRAVQSLASDPRSARQLWVTAFSCVGTLKPPWSGCGGVVGGKEPRSVALTILGALELSSGWHSDANHVRGVFNVAADGISSWDRDLVLRDLRSVRPDVPRQTQDFKSWGRPGRPSVLRCWSRALAERSYSLA